LRELSKLNLFPNLRTHLYNFPIKDEPIKSKDELRYFDYMCGRNSELRDAQKLID